MNTTSPTLEHKGGVRIEHLWALTVMVGIFVFLSTHPIRPHDFWWHMAVGREILTTGHIPTVDTFSFTAAGTPYPSYQMFWLPEVALYVTYTLGGPALVIFVHTLTVTTAYGLALWTAYHATHRWRAAAFATLLAAAVGLNDWNVRPQAFTFPIAALLLLAINRYRTTGHKGWLTALPLGMALWSNCHGSFPIGLILIGLWVLEEALSAWQTAVRPFTLNWHRLTFPLGTLAASSMACLINPQGLGIVTYVRTLSGDPAVQRLVPEWAPPTFDTLAGSLFLGGLLLTAALLALSPRRATPVQVLTYLMFGALGLKTSRGSIWFGLIMTPILAEHLSAFLKPAPRLPPGHVQARLNASLSALLLLAACATLPWFKERLPLPPLKAGLISAETPVEATEFLLREHLPGPLFHAQSFGSYLIWAAQPDYPVFVDSRIELYPLEVWQDYLAISSASCDWEERLAKYGIQTLMLSPVEQSGLVAAVQKAPQWQIKYADDRAVIVTRR